MFQREGLVFGAKQVDQIYHDPGTGARVLSFIERLAVQRIADLFPRAAYIKAIGLKEADDRIVWTGTKEHGFTIVSKGVDFYRRTIVPGHPPKFIWLRLGMCPTSLIYNALEIAL